MSNPNPPSKSVDINTQEGLNLLKTKARHYGHYAENLKVLELINIIENYRWQEKRINKVLENVANQGD